MADPVAGRQVELRDYLKILRRRKWTIILVTVVVALLGLVLSLQRTKSYSASATIILQPTGEPFDVSRAERAAAQTEIEIIQSASVLQLVLEEAPDAGSVSAGQVGESGVLAVTVRNADPERAAVIANAFVDAYIEFRRGQELDSYETQAVHLEARVDELTTQIDLLTEQRRVEEETIRNTFGPDQESLESAALADVETGLGRQIQEYVGQRFALRARLDDLETQAALSTGGASRLTEAGVPGSPVSPGPPRDVALAVGVGLLLGLALVFAFDYFDDSVKSKEDLDRATGGSLPLLATIPPIPTKRGAPVGVVPLITPHSEASEAFRSLRTAVHLLSVADNIQVLQVTSGSPREGKTTTVANLAVVLAQAGREVIVVDCDLRQPRLHELFDLGADEGLISLMMGEVTLSRALRKVAGIEHLRVLTAGPIPPNPSELLSSKQFVNVLATLRTEDALIVLDTPPVLSVTDAALLSAYVDATVLVVGSGSATRRRVERTVEALRQVDAPLVGAVLNQHVSDDAQDLGDGGRYYGTSSRKRRHRHKAGDLPDESTSPSVTDAPSSADAVAQLSDG